MIGYAGNFIFNLSSCFLQQLFNSQEELVAKVLEFLEKPHKTTDILLGQKELVRMAIIPTPSL